LAEARQGLRIRGLFCRESRSFERRAYGRPWSAGSAQSFVLVIVAAFRAFSTATDPGSAFDGRLPVEHDGDRSTRLLAGSQQEEFLAIRRDVEHRIGVGAGRIKE